MERPKIKIPEPPTQETDLQKRRRSIMPINPRIQDLYASQTNSSHEGNPEPVFTPMQFPPQMKKKKFEDSYTRFTTYLENPIHACVLQLREQGYINSATALVNDALRAYIIQHFGESFEL